MASWARGSERRSEASNGGQSRFSVAPRESSGGSSVDGIAALAPSGSSQRVHRNQVVFCEGEPVAHLYLVRSGSFKLVRHSEQGKELIVALVGEGEVFGALAEPSESTVLARALEDSVLLAIPLSAVRQAMAGSVELSLSLIRRAEHLLRVAESQAARLAFESVPRRLARLLLEATDDSGLLRFPLNQTELANVIGSSRETVCSFLNQLRREGVIEMPSGQIRIRDRARLESVE